MAKFKKKAPPKAAAAEQASDDSAASKPGAGDGSGLAETLGSGSGGSKPNLPSTYGPNSPARKAKDADAVADSFVFGSEVNGDSVSDSSEDDGSVYELPNAAGVGLPGRNSNAPTRTSELHPSEDS